jgi:MSHA biogenesis protein MshJ
MKRYREMLVLRLDALNLRERVMVFSGAALVVIFLMNIVLLDPAFNQQKKLSQSVKQDQDEISRIQNEIQGKVRLQGEDPDKVNQEKLKKIQQEKAELVNSLMGMEKKLVPPEKMTALLEDILKRNGRLRLISLKNLQQVNLSTVDSKKQEGAAAKTTAKADAIPAESGAIYQHAVEIVVHGNYMDVMNYLTALEAIRWQLYWSKAKFQVDTYPTGTLTLTVYTLSLDKTWLNF